MTESLSPFQHTNKVEEGFARTLELSGGTAANLLIPSEWSVSLAGSPEHAALALSLDTFGRFLSFANIFYHGFLIDNDGSKGVTSGELIFRGIAASIRSATLRLAPAIIARAATDHEFIKSPWSWALLAGIGAISIWETYKTGTGIHTKIIKPVSQGIQKIREKQAERKAAKSVQYINLEPRPQPEEAKPDTITLTKGQSASIKRIMSKMPPGPQQDRAIEAIIKRTQR